MTKDAKGHGSDSRGGSQYARQAPTKNGRMRMYGSSMADRIKVAQDAQNIKEGRSAGSAGNPLGHDAWSNTPGGDREAASTLSSGGPKSDPAPVHDAMHHAMHNAISGPSYNGDASGQREAFLKTVRDVTPLLDKNYGKFKA
jgi:hypothetical protein